jgi:hypothetical protein
MNQPAKSTVADEAEVTAPPKQLRPLAAPRLKIIRSSESDFGNLFGAVTPAGTDFEDVLRPDYWSLHAMKLRIGDTIEVHTEVPSDIVADRRTGPPWKIYMLPDEAIEPSSGPSSAR